MKINRTEILEGFLTNIYRFSDKEYQERVWIRAEGPEWDHPEESYNCFADSYEPIFEEYEKYNFSEKQYKLIQKLKDKLYEFRKKFPDILNPSTLEDLKKTMDLPEWQNIRNLAKEILESFDYKHVPYQGKN